jgi:hypothetical protein
MLSKVTFGKTVAWVALQVTGISDEINTTAAELLDGRPDARTNLKQNEQKWRCNAELQIN